MGSTLGKKDPPKQVTRELLQGFVGKTVEDFCKVFGKKGDSHNHCAHWVSHALGFRFGKLCISMSWEYRRDFDKGRTMVVSDLFNACTERGPWTNKPEDLSCCLIFGILEKGVSRRGGTWTMDNIRQKHVGIYLSDECYNYHNRKDEGVRVDGVSFFQNVYGKGTVALYAKIPD